MLVENIIHLVKTDNKGIDLTEVNQAFISKLSKSFGGCTVLDNTKGYWMDDGQLYKDNVLRVIIAFDPAGLFDVNTTQNNYDAFIDLAMQYKAQARQLAVYVVINNTVLFV